MSAYDGNVYIKRGNKYIPFGRKCGENYLPDGIWYVRHDKHSSSCTNMDHYVSGLFRVGDNPEEFLDIPQLCKMTTYVDYVLSHPEFRKIMDSGQFSFVEVTAKIVALVVELNKTLKNGTR